MKQQKFLSLLAAAAAAASCTLGTWQTTARAEDASGTAAETSAVPETVSMDDISALRTFLLEGTAPDGTALPDLNQDKVLDARDLTLAKRNLGTGFGLTNLRADIPDILLNKKETVTFTVEAEQAGLPEKTVALYDPDSEKPAAYMYDDGTHGDETASDGIYTAQLELQSDDFKNVDYYAAADGFKSDSFRICFYRELTEEELEGYFALQDQFEEIEDYDAACAVVKSSDEIVSYTLNDSLQTISFRTVYHISGFWDNHDEESDAEVSTETYATPPAFRRPQSPPLDIDAIKPLLLGLHWFEDYDEIEERIRSMEFTPAYPDKKDVIVLCPYQSSGSIIKKKILACEDTSTCGKLLAEALQSKATIVTDHAVTVEQMKQLSGYGTVLINTHGGIWPYNEDFLFVTGVAFDSDSNSKWVTHGRKIYAADFASERIIACFHEKRIAVTASFFDYYYEAGSLKDSFWFIGACHSTENNTMGNALFKKGVRCMAGMTWTTWNDYNMAYIHDAIINGMLLSGKSIGESTAEFIETHGRNNDTFIEEEQIDIIDGKEIKSTVLNHYYSIPSFFGNPNFRLVKECHVKSSTPDDPDTPVFPDDPDFVVDNELDFKLFTDADTKEQYYAAYGRPGNVDVVIPSTHEGKPVKAIGVQPYNKTHLRSVTIPSTITEIPDRAFNGCIRLTKVSLPSNLTKIGSFAFWSCKSLKSIDIPSSVQEIGDAAFGETALEKFEFTSKNHFDSIYRIFYGCKDLREVVLNVEADELDHTFEECTGLEKITFPKGLKKISSSTFYNCSSIKEFEIPDGVEELGDNALQYFTSLESLVIPDSVKVIGMGAVSHCFNLKKAVLPKSIEKIGNGTFGGCTHLTDVQMPQDVEVIGRSAFYECTSLRRIELPDTVKTIEAKAFSGCWGLVLDPLPPNIREIGAEAFSWCKFSSPNVQLPKSLQKLSLSAFDHCESILYVLNPDMEFAEPTITEQQAFDYVVERLMLHGYEGSTAQQFAENPDHPCKFYPIDPET